jgi:hypothetical protein
MTADPARSDDDALRALSVAYAAAADARDGDGLASLFVEDGALVVPTFPTDLRPVVTRQGHEAVRQVAEMLRRYDRTFHLVSNSRFAVDGDDASGEVQCVAHHVTGAKVPSGGAVRSGAESAGTDTVWFIRYRDRYRRSGTDWRFVRRELHLQWVEEHPVATLGPPSDGLGPD